jgi:hypothetical protein
MTDLLPLRHAGRVVSSYPMMTVFPDGSVRGPSGKTLSPFPNSRGYLCITVYFRRVWKQVRVHLLVCEAFHGAKPSPIHHVAHCNGNILDNKALNLRWSTPTENEADKVKHGTIMTGVRHHQAKLNETHVRSIREEYSKGGVTLGQLAVKHGVYFTTISKIVNRTTWRHL